MHLIIGSRVDAIHEHDLPTLVPDLQKRTIRALALLLKRAHQLVMLAAEVRVVVAQRYVESEKAAPAVGRQAQLQVHDQIAPELVLHTPDDLGPANHHRKARFQGQIVEDPGLLPFSSQVAGQLRSDHVQAGRIR